MTAPTVQVKGEYARFQVTSTAGTPGSGPTTYVRQAQPVNLTINDVGEAYRIPREGRQRIQFTYPPLQRYFSAGDELSLEISLSSPLYAESRVSDGVVVDPDASTVTLPQRPR